LLAGGAARAQQTSPNANWKRSDPNPAARSTPPQAPSILTYYKEPELPGAEVQPVGAQTLAPLQGMRPGDTGYSSDDFQDPIPLGLKEGGPNPVIRVESEANFNRRYAQKVRQSPGKEAPTPYPQRAIFPQEPVVSRQPYLPRPFPPRTTLVEPNYVCHGPLLFEQRNMERGGWDLGIIQPVVSGGVFVADALTLPYHLGAAVCNWPDCSAGKCLPGDPTPFLLYPPPLSLTGAVAEVGVGAALFAAFP
jgi:hypothetical protein